jgi:hypothetical protein
MTEQAKVRMLLRKVQHPQLTKAVEVLQIKAGMEGCTFTECANHLSLKVSELPDYQVNRKISATDSTKKGKPSVSGIRARGGASKDKDLGATHKGIHMPDGSIWTGSYPDWDKTSDADKQAVMDTRKKNKAKGTTPGKKKAGNDLKLQFAKMKCTFAAMQSKKSSNNDAQNDSDDSDVPDNGDAFGGRQKKKQKKE